MPPEDADRLLVRKALQQSAEATESLNKLLGSLVTKTELEPLTIRLGAVDAGVGLALSRFDELDEKLNASLMRVADAMDALTRTVMSAYDIASDAKKIAMNGNGHDPDSDDEPRLHIVER